MYEKVSLPKEDWDYLFGVESFKMGSTVLTLRPMDITEIKVLLGVIVNSKDYFIENNITPQNYYQPVQLIAMTRFLIELVPQIISDTAHLVVEDVKHLPPNIAVSLVRALIKINLKSKEGLIKNLTALATEITQVMTGGGLAMSPNFLFQEDISGKTSSITPSEKSESSSEPL